MTTSNDERNEEQLKTPSSQLSGLIIETSFGSNISNNTKKEESLAPSGDDTAVLREASSSDEKLALSEEQQEQKTEAAKKDAPAICPRATMELSSANELLTAIRYAFNAEGGDESAHEKLAQALESSSEISSNNQSGEHSGEDASSTTVEAHEEGGGQSAPSAQQKIDVSALLESLALNTGTVEQQPSSSEQSSKEETVIPSDALESSEEKEPEPEESADQEVSEFWKRCKELAKNDEWSEVNAFASSTSEASSHESKFWWILSQLRLKSLSPSLLTAPLQELLDTAPEGDFLNTAEARTALLALSREVVQAAIADGHSPSQVFTLLKQLSSCCGESCTFETEEQALIELLKKKKDYERSSFESEILSELETKLKAKTEKKKKPTKSQSKKKEDLEEKAQGVSGESYNVLDWVGHHLVRAIQKIASTVKEVRSWKLEGSHRQIKPLVAGVLLVCVFSYLIISLFSWGAIDQVEITLETKITDQAPELELPSQQSIDPRVFKGMLLDAGSSTLTNSRTSISPVRGSRKLVSARTFSGKGVVNTKGPIEPPDLLQNLDQVEQGPRPLTEDYVRNLGSDLLGERGEARKRNSSESVRMQAKLYRITADTNILSEPSINAKVLERVERGVKVKVVQRVGEWLLLSSHEGQPGYILREDAVEIGVSRS